MKKSEAGTKTINSKVEALQGLRGVAFLLIFISHCDIIQNQHGINMFTWLGALGVEIFLILSGYLNGYSYLMRSRPPVYNRLTVLASKVKKVSPLHIITLIMSLPLSIGFLLSIKGMICLGINALMLQSYIPLSSIYFSYNAVSWYLGVFLLCVALTPIVEVILRKIRGKKLYRFLCFIGLLLLQFGIYYIFREKNYAHWIIYVFPPTRVIDYILGAISAYIVIDLNSVDTIPRKTIVSVTLSFATIIIWILAVLSFSTKDEIFSVVCWTVPVMLLIPSIVLASCMSRLVNNVLGNRIIVFLGNISFECFLLHQLVIRYGNRIWNRIGLLDTNIRYIIYLSIVIVVAYGYKKVEERIR